MGASPGRVGWSAHACQSVGARRARGSRLMRSLAASPLWTKSAARGHTHRSTRLPAARLDCTLASRKAASDPGSATARRALQACPAFQISWFGLRAAMCSSSRHAWRSTSSHCESLHALPQHICELCMRSGSTTFDGRDHLEPNSLAYPHGPGTPRPISWKHEVTCYQSSLHLRSGRAGSVESYLVVQDRSLWFDARAGCPSRLGPSLRRISDQKPTKARPFVLLVKHSLKRSPGRQSRLETLRKATCKVSATILSGSRTQAS